MTLSPCLNMEVSEVNEQKKKKKKISKVKQFWYQNVTFVVIKKNTYHT